MKDGHEQWVMAGWRALIDGGVRAVRGEALARAIGVTKGSINHPFSGRQAQLDDMLDGWRERGTDAIIAVANQGSAPLERLTLLHEIIFASPHANTVESAIRTWATTDGRAQEATERVDRARIGYVANLLTEAGMERDSAIRRTTLYYRVVIGDAIWRTSGGAPLTARERDDLLAMFTSGLT
ncbi:MAG: hypothetical protein AAGI01_14025 [Myxococcota bacterium]